MRRRDDDFLDDERADALIRRMLARANEPTQVPAPPDLVTRTARRLPAEPPALAARHEARVRVIRLMLSAAVVALVALVALLGVMSALGGEAQIALMFGDGTSGLSRALLMLQLLAKPLLRTVGGIGAPVLLGGMVALLVAGWSWWWLLRRTPAYSYAENIS
jgi:hypothetical protein